MSGNQPIQPELPNSHFTTVPNVFLEEWVNVLGLLEIRIVAAILRRSFGWQLEWTRGLKVSELSEVTKHHRSLVIKALATLVSRGIIVRRRLSRRESFAYGFITRSELKPLKEVPPPAKQKALPYDVRAFSGSENSTTREVVKTQPLSGSKNTTTETPVLRSIKESRSKETHTPRARDQRDALPESVCADQSIDHDRYVAYAKAHPWLKDPIAWATVAKRTRQWDGDVLEWEEKQRADEIQRREEERQREIEIEQQCLELAALRERRVMEAQDNDHANPLSCVSIEETAAQKEFRERCEAADLVAQNRGEQIISDVRKRVEQRKLSTR